jgi:hypothetical protein
MHMAQKIRSWGRTMGNFPTELAVAAAASNFVGVSFE